LGTTMQPVILPIHAIRYTRQIMKFVSEKLALVLGSFYVHTWGEPKELQL
jgi:hypothetical protein